MLVCFVSSEVVALLVAKMHSFYVTLHYTVIAILTKMKPAGTEVFFGSEFLPLVECRAQLNEGYNKYDIYLQTLKAKDDYINLVSWFIIFRP